MKRINYILSVIIGLLVTLNVVNAQEVSVSSELNLRNYFSYEILSQVEDRIIVYRDKGFIKEIDVFNDEMENTISAEIEFEKKRVDVFSIMGMDSVFQILYGYFERDSMVIKYRIYDNKVQLRDSLTLIKIPKTSIRKKFSNVTSEDRNKILLSTVDEDDNILFLMYDCKKRLIEWTKLVYVDDEVARSLNAIELANNGDFVLILNTKNWFNNKEDLRMMLFKPRMRKEQFFSINLDDYSKATVFLKHDNKNQNLIISGTYGLKRGKEIKGYFYLCKPVESFREG